MLVHQRVLGIIIPTDFHIFQRGRYTTNQGWWMLMVHWWFLKDVSPIFNSYVKIPEGIWLMVHWWFLSNFHIYLHHSHFRVFLVLETNQKMLRQSLSLGFDFNQSLENVKLPLSLETRQLFILSQRWMIGTQNFCCFMVFVVLYYLCFTRFYELPGFI